MGWSHFQGKRETLGRGGGGGGVRGQGARGQGARGTGGKGDRGAGGQVRHKGTSVC